MTDLYQPLAAEAIESPLPMYRTMRSLGPVTWHKELGSWICTGYNECIHALSNPAVFTTDPLRVGLQVPIERQNIQTLDPPEYTAPRKVMTRGFQKVDLKGLVGRATEEARVRLDLYLDGRVSLVRTAGGFALQTVCDALGIDGVNEDDFIAISEDLVRGMDYGFRPESAQTSDDARAALSRMLDQLAREGKLSGLSKTLLSQMEEVDRSFALNSIRVLLHAGYSSSCRLLENSIAVVAERPETQDALRDASAAEWNLAVNEFVRYDGPVQAEARIIAEDVVLAGKELLRGDQFILILGAANTDPLKFQQSETIFLDRKPNQHLGFGRGIHSCLGSRIALVLVTTFIQQLLRLGNFNLDGSATRRDNATLRGFVDLPLTITPHLPQ